MAGAQRLQCFSPVNASAPIALIWLVLMDQCCVQVVLRAHPKTSFRRLFQVFSDTMGVNLGHVKFMGSTGRLDADDQLGSLGRGYAVITVQDVPGAMHDVSMGYINI